MCGVRRTVASPLSSYVSAAFSSSSSSSGAVKNFFFMFWASSSSSLGVPGALAIGFFTAFTASNDALAFTVAGLFIAIFFLGLGFALALGWALAFLMFFFAIGSLF